MRRPYFAAVVAAALTASTLPLAAGDTPWAERAIKDHIAEGEFAGTLDREALLEFIARGEALFGARFTELDGVGRPMATQAIIPTKRKRPPASEFHRTAGLDANACASCHNDPVMGGAGDFSVNVFVSEGFTNSDFDTTDPQFSNERNTNHLMGAGLVELLAREMTADLAAIRSAALRDARGSGAPVKAELVSKGVRFGAITALPDGIVDLSGIEGVDTDLVVRPFSQKGVMTSLRQFTINAANHHHGMQAEERFGPRWTGEKDFDADGHAAELTAGDVSALVAWQATLPLPDVMTPLDESWTQAAARGSDLFDDAGCAACHRRALPLKSLVFADPGPLDAAGTLRSGEAVGLSYDLGLLKWAETLERNEDGDYLVPLFADLKRHVMADRKVSALGNELLGQRFVERNVFQTAELWGIASTAPYGHRGDFTTLDGIIRAHGGDSRPAREAYLALGESERSDLIAFLKTLVISK
ncbi:di-heme oxidoredictase family protein [Oricola sp.]|uniref:di-heme oxidoredictase family protein n=1 Tax=Oricola sp. TaxID=1979950 RepID=UPI003BACD7E7